VTETRKLPGKRIASLVASVFALSLPAAAAAGPPTFDEASPTPSDRSMSPAAQRAYTDGYLVPDEQAYAQAKAQANAQAAAAGQAEPAVAERAPAIAGGRTWNGVFQTTNAPSDSTGAVGRTRYIELINTQFAIYNKTSNTPISTGQLNTLFAQSAGTNSFDPQIIWDPGTNRFFYAGDSVVSASDNRLSFGFSKTASPNNGAADWCHYQVNYGADFPDYPKLGDSSFFTLIGVNTFNSSDAFIGSDLIGISKPPAGTTCPNASTFKFGTKLNIQDTTGGPAFTPVAVNQTDSAATGYFVARTGELPSTRLQLFRATRNATTGNPVFSNASAIPVPSYTVPADARQTSPSTKVLDTMDSRPTQAVSGLDPTPAGVNNAPGAIWTQHTALGGAGAEVRWYEIDPVSSAGPPALVQSGKVTSASLFNFNGAISPNRSVLGATTSGGDAMVLGYDASSTSLAPRVRMVSKVGTAAQSAPVNVRTSPGPYTGFDCAGGDNLCRWGDYAAATPDPATANRVWLTSQYASGGTSTAQANWRTWNWAATP
jgi:hypothetical protein